MAQNLYFNSSQARPLCSFVVRSRDKASPRPPSQARSVDTHQVRAGRQTTASVKVPKSTLPGLLEDLRKCGSTVIVDDAADPSSLFYALQRIQERDDKEFWYAERVGEDPYHYKLIESVSAASDRCITVSARGIQTVGSCVEFTPINQWIREYSLHRRLLALSFFKNFPLWRKFVQWRKAQVSKTRESASSKLSRDLFVLDPSMRHEIFRARHVLQDMMLAEYSLIMKFDGVYSFQTFSGKQAAHCLRRTNKLQGLCESFFAVVASCAKLLHKSDDADASSSRSLSKREKNLKLMFRFMLRKSIADLVIADTNSFMQALAVERGRFTSTILFDGGALRFSPQRNYFLAILDDILSSLLTNISSDSVVPVDAAETLTTRSLIVDDPSYTRAVDSMKSHVSTCFEQCEAFVKELGSWSTAFEKCSSINGGYVRSADPPSAWFRDTITYLKQLLSSLDEVPTTCTIGLFAVDMSSVAATLRPLARDKMKTVLNLMPVMLLEKLTSFYVRISHTVRVLSSLPTTLEALTPYLSFASSLRMQEIEDEYSYILEMISTLESEKDSHTSLQDVLSLYNETSSIMLRIRELVFDFQETKESLLTLFGKQIAGELETLRLQTQSIITRMSSTKFNDIGPDAEARLAAAKLNETDIKAIASAERRLTEYQSEFCVEVTPVEEVAHALSLSRLQVALWSEICRCEEYLARVRQTPWSQLSSAELNDFINQSNEATVACASLQPNSALKWLIKQIEFLKGHQFIAEILSNRSLQSHHWRQIDEVTSDRIKMALSERKEVTLQHLVDVNIASCRAAITGISQAASNEAELDREVSTVHNLWTGKSRAPELAVVQYRDHKDMWIVGENAEAIQAQLEDSRLATAALRTSRHCVGTLRSRAHALELTLELVSSTLEEWLRFQDIWIRVEGAFAVPETSRLWQDEEKMFRDADTFYRDLMRLHSRGCNIFTAASNGKLLESFLANIEKLELVLNAIESKLDSKRQVFPRLYFISDRDLLALLSMSRTPEKVSVHTSKLFENINSIQVTQFGEITAVVGFHNEIVSLTKSLRARGDVEKWLATLERSICETVRDLLFTALRESNSATNMEWTLGFPQQCSSSAYFLRWSSQVTDNPHNELETLKRDITQLVATAKQELTPLHRILVSSLTTQLINLRSTTLQIAKDLSISCLKLASEEKELFVRLDGHSLKYAFEYQGARSRLVETDAIRKSFRSIFFAQRSNYGALLHGPTATGKTESIRELANVVGKACVVFNCGEGVSRLTAAKLLCGAAQSCVWLCFDEFNRIHANVLSIIAVQVAAIKNAACTNAAFFVLEGKELRLGESFGIFATMNPSDGYGHRTELPDNVKALFRPAAVVLPDKMVIVETVLMSEGFLDAGQLSQKVVSLFDFCERSLSKLSHYDFGMRTIKSALALAANIRRCERISETEAVMQACIECTAPRLDQDDRAQFDRYLRNVFVLDVHRNQSHLLTDRIMEFITSCGHQACQEQVSKMQQFVESSKRWFGVAVVGAAGIGKSMVISASTTALSNHSSTHSIFPSAITYGELFGWLNSSTQRWCDGILSTLLRGWIETWVNDDQQCWIVFDGAIALAWVETLNSALDDTRTLCFDNGQRLKLPPSVHFVFECEHLNHASPATVSRLGIVFLAQEDLPLDVILSDVRDVMKHHAITEFDAEQVRTWAKDLIQFAFKHLDGVVTPTERQLATNFLCLMKSVLNGHCGPASASLAYQSVAFALVWSIGCWCNADSIERFDLACREIFDCTCGSFPPSGTVYDYKLHDGRWIRWVDLMERPTVNLNPTEDTIVPVVDHFRLNFFASLSSQHILVSGATGVGKSAAIRSLLPRDDVVCVTISSRITSRTLSQYIEKKIGRGRSKSCLCAVEDLNHGSVDSIGAAPIIELLRQMISKKTFLDPDKPQLRKSADFVLLASSGVQRKFKISPRLIRHTFVYEIVDLVDVNSRRVFADILSDHFGRDHDGYKFHPEVKTHARRLLEATTDVLCACRKELPHVTTKPYLGFNMHDIRHIVSRFINTHPKAVRDVGGLSSLWMTECRRTLRDRLMCVEELATFDRILDEVGKRNHFVVGRVDISELWSSRFRSDKLYSVIVDVAKAKQSLSSDQQVVMSNYFFHHVCRTIESLQVGDCAVVGPSGIGKKTVIHTACSTAGFSMFNASSCRSTQTFNEVLKEAALSAFQEKITVVVIHGIDDAVEEVVEATSLLLRCNDIEYCFTQDEYEKVVGLAMGHPGFSGTTNEAAFQYFCRHMRKYLRVAVSTSQASAKFKSVCNSFPSLVTHTTINSLEAWSSETLREFALRNLLGVWDKHHIDTVIAVFEVASSHKNQFGLVPSNVAFLDFIHVCKEYFKDALSNLEEDISRLSSGVRKMEEMQELVKLTEAELLYLEPLILQKADIIAALVNDTAEKQAIAQDMRAAVATHVQIAQEEERFASLARGDAEADLSAAWPQYQSAMDALKLLQKSDIDELKKYTVPTKAVSSTIEAVLTILREKKAGDWATAKQVLSQGRFIDRLLMVDIASLDDGIIARVKRFTKDSDFTPEKVGISGSEACRPLCAWVHAVEHYWNVHQVISPKRDRYVEASGNADFAQVTLTESQQKLAVVESNLFRLEKELAEAQTEYQRLQAGLLKCNQRLTLANALTSSLASEALRWKILVDELEKKRAELPRQTILLSILTCYGSSMLGHERESLLRDACSVPGLTLTPMFDPLTSVERHVILEWEASGLPRDAFARQNAVVLFHGIKFSKRWSYIVDPEGQAFDWIRRTSEFQGASCVEHGDKDLKKTLERNITFGIPTILTKTPAHLLDASLHNVLHRNIVRRADGSCCILIGSEMRDYNPKFRLIMFSGDTQPHITADTMGSARVINFSFTDSAMDEQVLGDVVSIALKEVEQSRDQNLLSLVKASEELNVVQRRILQKLQEASGNILDNAELAQELQHAQSLACDIRQSIATIEEKNLVLDSQRNAFTSVAKCIRLLFTSTRSIQCLGPQYDYGFAYIRRVSLNVVKSCHDAGMSTSLWEDVTLAQVYNLLRRGILANHRPVLDLLVSCNILLLRDIVTNRDVDLLAGRLNSTVDLVTLDQAWGTDLASSAQQIETCTSFSELLPHEPIHVRCIVSRYCRHDLFYDAVNAIFAAVVPARSEAEVEAFGIDEMNQDVPMNVVGAPGSDPVTWIQFHARMRHVSLRMVSMGNNETALVQSAVFAASQEGHWIVIQNAHLEPSTVVQVLSSLSSERNANSLFRLFFTCPCHAMLPPSVMRRSAKMVIEKPQGVITEDIRRSSAGVSWSVYLQRLHVSVLARKALGCVGWSSPYEFGDSDFLAASGGLQFLNSFEDLVKVVYGSRLSDEVDETVLKMLCYHVQTDAATEQYLDGCIDALSEFNHRARNAREIENCLSEFAVSSAGPQGYTLAAQTKYLKEVLAAVPQEIDKDMAHVYHSQGNPFSSVMHREVQSVNSLIAAIRSSILTSLSYLSGGCVIDDSISLTLTSLHNKRVPAFWMSMSAPWDPEIGTFLMCLRSAVIFFSTWLNNSGHPKVLSLSTLRFPAGINIALAEHVAQQQHCSVTSFEVEYSVADACSQTAEREDMLTLLDLHTDGFLWNGVAMHMEPPVRLSPHLRRIPAVSATVVGRSRIIAESNFRCPLYQTKSRESSSRLGYVSLSPGSKSASHWLLQGAALCVEAPY